MICAVALFAAFGGQPAMANEQPAYQVETKDGAFEVRTYDAMIVAEVAVGGARETAINRGFDRLAGYIFGANQRRDRIAMTAPVTQAADGGQWRVRFVMPSIYTMASLPAPNDPSVQLREQPAQRVAVVRFSGAPNAQVLAQRAAALADWVAARGLVAQGEPSYAFYDPPWTPAFLRRNEVMVALR